MRISIFTLVALSAVAAYAAGGEHGDHHVPWMELVIPQIVNFTAVVVGLIILLKKPVRAYFLGQYEQFESARKAAEKARTEAEVRHQQAKRQIAELDASAEKSLKEAQTTAATLKERIVREAGEAAEKITTEADRMVSFELGRATAALKMELINDSLSLAEKNLRVKAEKTALQKLNDEFIEKIRTVAR